jgi:hypothetical protein
MIFTHKRKGALPTDETVYMNLEENSQTKSTKLILNLILNLSIVVMELIAVNMSWKNQGFTLFQYYTENSNILALIACVTCSIFLIKSIITRSYAIPNWVLLLKYMAVCCLTVTFVVVVLVLAPMQGSGGYPKLLFSGSLLYQHFLCPILALAGFLVLDDGTLHKQDIYFAMVPTIFYALIAILLNLVKVLEGPYPFLRVNQQPILTSIFWFAVILGGAYVCSWLILFFCRRRNLNQ